jgi:hypothetical protein
VDRPVDSHELDKESEGEHESKLVSELIDETTGTSDEQLIRQTFDQRDVYAILTKSQSVSIWKIMWPGTWIARGFPPSNPCTRCTLQKLMIFDSLQTAKLGV